MRVLHLSHSDGRGGAGLASFQLHVALRSTGFASTMLVQRKTSRDDDVEVVPTHLLLETFRLAQRLLPRLNPSRRFLMFNEDRTPPVEEAAFFSKPRGSVDVVYLHWIARLLSSELLNRVSRHFACPIVWIPMDVEPVTGGCHYAGECQRFHATCGRCPVLGSDDEDDRSRKVWLQKRQFLTDLPITFVSASSWMTKQIRASGLFGSHEIVEIGLAVDTDVFSPNSREAARQRWNLPAGKKIIFIGAQNLEDPRKGMRELCDALERLSARLKDKCAGGDKVEEPLLLIVGSGPEVFRNRLPFPTRFIDRLTNRRDLATAYRCADLYVCPSIDDAGPMMIPEAMLCGTPTVAFNMGGAPDLIDSGVTGYMARLGDVGDLAEGIVRVMTEYPKELGVRAHAAAFERHHPARVAARHVALCERLTSMVPSC